MFWLPMKKYRSSLWCQSQENGVPCMLNNLDMFKNKGGKGLTARGFNDEMDGSRKRDKPKMR